MTLERHRSKLIPDVEYGGDGTVYVTSGDGTFPLRGKETGGGGRIKRDIRDMEFGTMTGSQSYHSFDAERERKRKFKQRPEIPTLSGTVSTGSSHSLGRRLRRSKKSGGSEDSRYDSKRLRKGTPKMTQEFAATLLRDKKARSVSSRSSQRKHSKDNGAYPPSLDYNGNGHLPLVGVSDTPLRHRRIHEERLPFIIPLVVGPGLVLVGVARLVISYWHEYFCGLWTGALLLTLGIIGARHKGSYLDVGLNTAYILFALLSAIATLISPYFVLKVLVPTLKLLAEQELPAQVVKLVDYTNMDKRLVPIAMELPIMTWLSVALDISALCLLLVGFYSLTAALIAMGNHWDAAYDTTSDCDHRGNPRIFNPLEQVSLGQATTFIGIVVIVILDTVGAPHQLYWSPVWAGVTVMLAGFATMFFGKRADKCCLCGWSSAGQLLAIGGVGVAVVFITLAMVKDVTSLMDFAKTKGSPMPSITTEESYMKLSAVVAEAVYLFVAIVNIIFIVGSMFRNCRQACLQCTSEPDDSDVSANKL